MCWQATRVSANSICANCISSKPCAHCDSSITRRGWRGAGMTLPSPPLFRGSIPSVTGRTAFWNCANKSRSWTRRRLRRCLPRFGCNSLSAPGMTEEMRSLRRPDGANLAYGITRGTSPRPLLALIHGLASNMTRWSEFIEQTTLAQTWDLMRLDLRGHAGSLWRGRIGMEIWCDDLAAILDAEGYKRAVVGGHCLGANLAVHFAQRHAQRTQGLVLIEPMPPE